MPLNLRNFDEVDNAPVVEEPAKDNIFHQKLGFWHYSVKRPSPEIVSEWKLEVDTILAALRHGVDLNEFVPRDCQKLTDKEKMRIKFLEDKLKDGEALDNEDLTLIAIGIFILKNKGRYSNFYSNLKAYKGGDFPLEELFFRDKYHTCLERASAVKILAEEYGISGEIVGTRKFGHRYFCSQNGKIVDFFWHHRAGWFESEKEFFEHVRKLPLLLRLFIFGLFSYSDK